MAIKQREKVLEHKEITGLFKPGLREKYSELFTRKIKINTKMVKKRVYLNKIVYPSKIRYYAVVFINKIKPNNKTKPKPKNNK